MIFPYFFAGWVGLFLGYYILNLSDLLEFFVNKVLFTLKQKNSN